MPDTAIAAGVVDLMVPVEEMPRRLVDHVRRYWPLGGSDFADEDDPDPWGADPGETDPGSVLVQGNRIQRVGRGPRSLPTVNVTTIDGAARSCARRGQTDRNRPHATIDGDPGRAVSRRAPPGCGRAGR